MSFTYNDEGIRTSKNANGVKHSYSLNGSQIIMEDMGGSVLVYLYDASGSPIGMQYRNRIYDMGAYDNFWFEKNLQGDIVAVYDEDGTKLISYTYDAWGNFTTTYHNGCTASHIANLNPFRYRGYYYDSELGMYYLQSRYYDPVIGRFISADSVVAGIGGGILGNNMYAYAFNNPVNLLDQDGNWPQWIKDTVKWTAKNIINPVVKGAQKLLSHIDITRSSGFSVGTTLGMIDITVTPSVAIDTKGNIGSQLTIDGAFTTSPGLGEVTLGLADIATFAPDISKLLGDSYFFGGSYFTLAEFIPVGGGANVCLIPDSSTDKTYLGFSSLRGISSSLGGSGNVGLSKTIPIFPSINIFDEYDKFYNDILEW